MAFGPGDEEGRDVIGADIVEVAGDAERFGRLLPADLRRVEPPAEEDHHGEDGGQSEDEIRMRRLVKCGIDISVLNAHRFDTRAT